MRLACVLPALLLCAHGCASTSAEGAQPAPYPQVSHQGSASADGPDPRQAAVRAAQRTVQSAEREGETAKAAPDCGSWPLWERFVGHFVQRDGRVVDRTAHGRSTSEGQAYALFFALVNADRKRFDRILAWTENNLSQGSLADHLPAWLWGERPDGGHGVLDPNSASDADVWLAYTLLEAARIWSAPAYAAQGSSLARLVLEKEVRLVPDLGHVLLPGPHGFVHGDKTVRLNPSYLFLPLFHRLAETTGDARFTQVAASSRRILARSAPQGLLPDWVQYTQGAGFSHDTEHGAFGSYDAIRGYLWAAMLPRDMPGRAESRHFARAFHDLVTRIGRVPERIQIQRQEVSTQSGPPGFVAVAQAVASALGDKALARSLGARLDQTKHDGLLGQPAAYYDQVLALFALGFMQHRYAFGGAGELKPRREFQTCQR